MFERLSPQVQACCTTNPTRMTLPSHMANPGLTHKRNVVIPSLDNFVAAQPVIYIWSTLQELTCLIQQDNVQLIDHNPDTLRLF